ncbi:hypothetical protein [Acinetobacter soli]|uniref:hypothetical protein n=1 Tax=Acinetobacter soli TaxID=487316 RepID=UPI0004691E2E|nr:hypothetical protein [Acinetobacter soli]
MAQLFFKAETFKTKKSTPRLTNVKALYPSGELDSFDHWVFVENDTPLVGIINNKTLTAQAGTVAPVYSSLGVTLAGSQNNGLLSTFLDAASNDYTIACVQKRNNTQNSILLGSSVSILLNGAVQPVFQVRGVSPLVSPTAPVLPNTTSAFFSCISVNKTSKTINSYFLQNAYELAQTNTYTGAYTAANLPIGVGNVGFAFGADAATAITHEFIIFDKALSAAEIKSLALRARDRLNIVGIYF